LDVCWSQHILFQNSAANTTLYSLCFKKYCKCTKRARFRAFSLVSWRSSLFWVVLHHSLANHWPFGIAYRSHLQRWRCSSQSNQPQVRSNPVQGRSQGVHCFAVNTRFTLAIFTRRC
jgi:hypothetical protein